VVNTPLEIVIAQAKEAVALMERLEKVDVPSTLADAVAANWMEEGSATDELVARLPAGSSDIWRKRLISIDKANELLVELENRMVAELVLNRDQVIWRSVSFLGALLTILPAYTGAALTALVEIGKSLSKETVQIEIGLIFMEIFTWVFATTAEEKLLDASRLSDSIQRLFIDAAIKVHEIFASQLLKPMILAVGTLSAYALTARPIVAAQKTGTADAMKRCMGIGTPGRVRRRKRAR